MSSHDWLNLAQLLHNHFKKISIGANWSGVRYLGDQVFNHQKNWSGANQHKLANFIKGGPFEIKWYLDMSLSGQVTDRKLLHNHFKKISIGANWSGVRYLGDQGGPCGIKRYLDMSLSGQVTG